MSMRRRWRDCKELARLSGISAVSPRSARRLALARPRGIESGQSVGIESPQVDRVRSTIDNQLAHRPYHGVPKSIRRRGNKGGGAILGFASFLLRLYVQEQPRAVLVGWDTLDTPTYRHRALETYQSGRVFDLELLDQLDVLPEF